MTLLASIIAGLIMSTKWTVWLFVLGMLAGAVLLLCLFQFLLLFFAFVLNAFRFGRQESGERQENVFETSLIRVVSEATPPGVWQTELFRAKGFGHSEIYDDQPTADSIVRWLRESTERVVERTHNQPDRMR